MSAHKSGIQENGPYAKKFNQLIVGGEIVQNWTVQFTLLWQQGPRKEMWSVGEVWMPIDISLHACQHASHYIISVSF